MTEFDRPGLTFRSVVVQVNTPVEHWPKPWVESLQMPTPVVKFSDSRFKMLDSHGETEHLFCQVAILFGKAGEIYFVEGAFLGLARRLVAMVKSEAGKKTNLLFGSHNVSRIVDDDSLRSVVVDDSSVVDILANEPRIRVRHDCDDKYVTVWFCGKGSCLEAFCFDFIYKNLPSVRMEGFSGRWM